jgi:hypothetical protein
MGGMSLAVNSLVVIYVDGIGSGDKKIAIWDTQATTRDLSISPIHKLDAKSFGAPNVVAINPRSALLATASTELVTILSRRNLQ